MARLGFASGRSDNASLLIWGCTGFDGGVEAGIAGGGVALLKTASL